MIEDIRYIKAKDIRAYIPSTKQILFKHNLDYILRTIKEGPEYGAYIKVNRVTYIVNTSTLKNYKGVIIND